MLVAILHCKGIKKMDEERGVIRNHIQRRK
jgi:hypothetical protein